MSEEQAIPFLCHLELMFSPESLWHHIFEYFYNQKTNGSLSLPPASPTLTPTLTQDAPAASGLEIGLRDRDKTPCVIFNLPPAAPILGKT